MIFCGAVQRRQSWVYILSGNKYIAEIEAESKDSASIFLPSLQNRCIINGAFSYFVPKIRSPASPNPGTI